MKGHSSYDHLGRGGGTKGILNGQGDGTDFLCSFGPTKHSIGQVRLMA